MTDEAITQPTIQTLLERMDAVCASMRAGFATMEERLGGRLQIITEKLDDMGTRLDRTQAMVYDLRAKFRDLRGQLRELIGA
jgi:hypothetical protein